jgi:hypothetical protein
MVAHEASSCGFGASVRRVPVLQQLLQVVAHQFEQQRLLVGGIEVKRARLHAHLGRDLAHGNGGEPVPREQPQGRRRTFGPVISAVTALFARHGRRLSERAFNSTGMDKATGPSGQPAP